MWSIGCILYELLYCSSDVVENVQKENINQYINIRHAFRGHSCYPISPCFEALKKCNDDKNIVSGND